MVELGFHPWHYVRHYEEQKARDEVEKPGIEPLPAKLISLALVKKDGPPLLIDAGPRDPSDDVVHAAADREVVHSNSANGPELWILDCWEGKDLVRDVGSEEQDSC